MKTRAELPKLHEKKNSKWMKDIMKETNIVLGDSKISKVKNVMHYLSSICYFYFPQHRQLMNMLRTMTMVGRQKSKNKANLDLKTQIMLERLRFSLCWILRVDDSEASKEDYIAPYVKDVGGAGEVQCTLTDGHFVRLIGLSLYFLKIQVNEKENQVFSDFCTFMYETYGDKCQERAKRLKQFYLSIEYTY